MKGYIWYHKGIQFGSESDFLVYQAQYPSSKVVMVFSDVTMHHLQNIANNLMRSNFPKALASRFSD
ncbi:hypothetical protein [Marinoscillum furvescens]|uniref:Uncharacterized protein n=1 Tax=Marinoscillum furvescens DSM 4134 TaxID=1122208 RepID=A0A3D9L2C6_MARFU|nr:hypothetical protein [Marinoscillum furvescens]RED96662.1 hypothetical protein C7460_114120 [Marinoscillum furvescens DSM 4134]